MIGQLGLGEALVSTLDSKGVPGVVQRILIAPPRSRFGPIDAQQRTQLIDRSPLKGIYDQALDRESAYEMLNEREQKMLQQREQEAETRRPQATRSKSRREGLGLAFAKSVARAIGSNLGRQIVRGILGSIRGGRR